MCMEELMKPREPQVEKLVSKLRLQPVTSIMRRKSGDLLAATFVYKRIKYVKLRCVRTAKSNSSLTF
jgi:hypothetical protein